jgi:hypothetical protein
LSPEAQWRTSEVAECNKASSESRLLRSRQCCEAEHWRATETTPLPSSGSWQNQGLTTVKNRPQFPERLGALGKGKTTKQPSAAKKVIYLKAKEAYKFIRLY